MVQLHVRMNRVTQAALLDELHKIAASRGRMTVAQSRAGKRPMSVETLLRKEKDGSLFKEGMTQAEIEAGKVLPRKKLQFPDLDDIGSSPRTEARQTSMGTTALAPRIGED